MKSKSKCYWAGCQDKISYKWYPNKNTGHLFVCKSHYDLLLQVFSVEVVDADIKKDYISVRVLPEPGDV